MNLRQVFDVAIVGAGPAGLSAALWLGRCRRPTLLCSAGDPRNFASHGLHGFLSRNGIPPDELLRLGREELAAYASVESRNVAVMDAVDLGAEGFELTFADSRQARCKKLLLATGVVDELPAISNIEQFYGRSVLHCPYCDGWEVRDQPLAVYGAGKAGFDVSLLLTIWSSDVTLCSNGSPRLSFEPLERMRRHGIKLRRERIQELRGNNGELEAIVFADQQSVPCRALFFCTRKYQHSNLAAKLGCEFERDGCARVGKYQVTNVPNLYIAGDAAGSMQLAIVAASEGAQAAIAINKSLLSESSSL